MIERLYPEQYRFGGKEAAHLERQTQRAREALEAHLDQEGRELLEAYQYALLRQTNLELRGAFTHGFCAGMELALEYVERQGLLKG